MADAIVMLLGLCSLSECVRACVRCGNRSLVDPAALRTSRGVVVCHSLVALHNGTTVLLDNCLMVLPNLLGALATRKQAAEG